MEQLNSADTAVVLNNLLQRTLVNRGKANGLVWGEVPQKEATPPQVFTATDDVGRTFELHKVGFDETGGNKQVRLRITDHDELIVSASVEFSKRDMWRGDALAEAADKLQWAVARQIEERAAAKIEKSGHGGFELSEPRQPAGFA